MAESPETPDYEQTKAAILAKFKDDADALKLLNEALFPLLESLGVEDDGEDDDEAASDFQEALSELAESLDDHFTAVADIAECFDGMMGFALASGIAAGFCTDDGTPTSDMPAELRSLNDEVKRQAKDASKRLEQAKRAISEAVEKMALDEED